MEEKPGTSDQPTAARTPRRLWYQFSLRSLLLFVTIIGCGFGWFGAKVREARQQAAAVAAIEKLGGVVEYDFVYDLHENVADPATRGPAWLRPLLGDDFLSNVYRVWLPTTRDGVGADANLEHVTGFARLKVLDLTASRVTDAGLERLKALTELRVLDLPPQVSDAGLEHLKTLTQLRWLWLDETHVTDAGLKSVEGLARLESLSLYDTQITDAGLEHISGLSHLTYLQLSRTRVTDAGLEHLKGLTRLEELWLQNTRLTRAGVGELQLALPNCKIDWTE